MIPDCELLHRYAAHGDEAAFADLVRRHTDLVYSVSWRVMGSAALAEDVTQAVFTQLAGQARTLAGYRTLVGWLHTTTRHIAINVVRGEARRRAREQEAFAMQDHAASPTGTWSEIRPLLDEAVGHLREVDRQALMLRFFNGLSHQEVGVVLGLSENSANKRVERALEKLRQYFSRHGVTASAAILAEAMSANSVQAAPAALADNISKTALTSGAAVGVAGNSLFLTFLYMSTKTKIILAAIILLAVIGTVAIKRQSSGDSLAPVPVAAKTEAAPARVAAPVMAAVSPKSSATIIPAASQTPPMPSVSFVGPITAGPKTDLGEAIATGIHYIESQDTASFLKTLMPPMGKEGDAFIDAMVAKISQDPRSADKLNNMLLALHAIQDQNLTPAINDAQTRATYTFDAPVGGHKVLIFNKTNGFWYLDGM